MTKGTLTAGAGSEKPTGGCEPVYVPIPNEQVTVTRPVRGINHRSAKSWYVLSLLATFCCLPICGIIGLIHAMIAQHEGERGNVAGHRRRLHQAKCWTGWSIGLGLAITLLFVVYAMVMVFGYMSPDYWTCTIMGWDMPGNSTDIFNTTQVPEIIYN